MMDQLGQLVSVCVVILDVLDNAGSGDVGDMVTKL